MADDEEEYYVEGSEGDEGGDDMLFEEPPEPVNKSPYKFIKKDELAANVNNIISEVSGITSLSKRDSITLLRYYKCTWNDETSNDYFSNQELLKKKLELGLVTPPPPSGTFSCPVCFEDVKSTETFALPCGHRYCHECWGLYINECVRESYWSLKIKCIFPTCLSQVSLEEVKQLASPSAAKRFEHFFLKNFVETHKKYTFCPNASCEYAVQFLESGKPTKFVDCKCGKQYCFCCGNEKHNPVSCQQLAQWVEKNQSNEEALKMIKAVAKQCPKCQIWTERNEGCNHMKCAKCSMDWCWMCRKEWAPHGSSWYKCFQYEASDAKKLDDEASRYQAELDHFKKFYSRFFDHQRTERDAENRRETIRKKSIEYREKTNFNADFLLEALDLLITCRHTLKYIYVYQFFTEKEAPSKVLSELLVEQKNLAEHFTELLADLLFAPVDKIDHDKLKNHIRVTQKYLHHLVEGLEEIS